MGITRTSLGSNNSPAGTGTQTTCILTTGQAVPVGAVVVVAALVNGNGKTMTCADSKGNTYTQQQTASQANTLAAQIWLFSAKITTALTATDTITITCGTASTSLGIAADILTGASGNVDSTPVANASNSTGSTTPNAGPIPIGSGSMAYLVTSNAISQSITANAPTGFATLYNIACNSTTNSRGLLVSGGNSSPGSSVTPQQTIGGVHQWAAIAASFSPAKSWQPAGAQQAVARASLW